MRKLLSAQDEKSKKSGGDGASYPFWLTPEGKASTIRFVPDGNPDNTLFWVEKHSIRLEFADGVSFNVPCIDTWDPNSPSTCKIIAHLRPWWGNPVTEPLARKYYKKRSYLMQGFVVNSAFEEENVPANPIRRFVVNSSIYKIVRDGLMNPELEESPSDVERGRDFKISKTKQGQFASYTTSAYSFRERPLSEAERAAIATHGLPDLSTFLGKKPDAEELAAQYQLFLESLDGKPFDASAYGKWYKPYVKGGPAPAPAATPVHDRANTIAILDAIKNKNAAGIAPAA